MAGKAETAVPRRAPRGNAGRTTVTRLWPVPSLLALALYVVRLGRRLLAPALSLRMRPEEAREDGRACRSGRLPEGWVELERDALAPGSEGLQGVAPMTQPAPCDLLTGVSFSIAVGRAGFAARPR